MKRILTTLAVAIVMAVALSACGSSDQTAAAAQCLRNAVANDSLHSGGPNSTCGDPTAYDAMKAVSATVPNVSCTHQNGNQYICDVTSTDSGSNGLNDLFATGFFAVTYDGHSIVYQAQ